MPRPWKKKPIIEDNRVVTLKKLIKVGDSHALVIPKDWLHFFAIMDDEGEYWVKVQYDGTNKLIIGGDND